MIADALKNAASYRGMHPGIARALAYLESTDVSGLAPGRYEIEGSAIYALVQEYETRPPEKGLWEAHRKYIDVQYVAEGVEAMGYAPIGSMTETKPYDPEHDYALFSGQGVMLTVPAGCFTVFLPQDVHMPCMTAVTPGKVRKVVVKVALA